MQKFLESIAQHFWNTQGSEIGNYVFVFPNKRSSLYMMHYLQNSTSETFLMPEFVTINELFQQHSSLVLADSLTLNLALYQVMKKVRNTTETFEEFYEWGNVLLADFDAIDKHLVNPDTLFQNVVSLKEIEQQFDYLTEEQKEALSQFWRSFESKKESPEQRNFKTIWGVLAEVYRHFNTQLSEQHYTYEGKLFREVIESLEQQKFEAQKYVFIGFNVLSKTEEILFEYLQHQGKAAFYWDYDLYFTESPYSEAGAFIRHYLKKFPTEGEDFHADNRTHNKEIQLIACPSEISQAKYVGQYLQECPLSEFDETAIVLGNEQLLLPVLNSLPEKTKKLNVTMGYPVTATPLVGFLQLLGELHRATNLRTESEGIPHAIVLKLLQHNYVQLLDREKAQELIAAILESNLEVVPWVFFKDTAFTSVFCSLQHFEDICNYLPRIFEKLAHVFNNQARKQTIERENLFHVYKQILRLNTVLEASDTMSVNMYFRLLLKTIGNLSIPFSGEPIEGLQVLGFLETRLLDFKQVIMLSANEGYLPKITIGSSFIPYNLRIAVGLPTIDQHNAMFAYYFYRLLSRAEQLVILHVMPNEISQIKEESRYLTQLRYESSYRLKEKSLVFSIDLIEPKAIALSKGAEIQTVFQDFFDGNRSLSPSAINVYLRCPLSFYFRYVASIPEPKTVEKSDDNRIFGSLFHEAADLIYSEFQGELISKEILRKMSEEANIRAKLKLAFQKILFKEQEVAIKGKNLLIFEIVSKYLKRLLKQDEAYAPFRLIGLESVCTRAYKVKIGEQTKTIRIKGTIDRLDEKDGVIRVIDYKTGNVKHDFSSIEQLFEIGGEKRNNAALQTLLYASMSEEKGQLAPAIFSIKKPEASPFLKMGNARNKEEIVDFSQVEKDYEARLEDTLAHMFDLKNTFTQTTIKEDCQYCAYATMCFRTVK